MPDETEAIRREMVAEINANAGPRSELEAKHGQVWDTAELGRDFEVLGFAAPFVVVRRRSRWRAGIVDVPAHAQALLRLEARIIDLMGAGSLRRTSPSLVAKTEIGQS